MFDIFQNLGYRLPVSSMGCESTILVTEVPVPACVMKGKLPVFLTFHFFS